MLANHVTCEFTHQGWRVYHVTNFPVKVNTTLKGGGTLIRYRNSLKLSTFKVYERYYKLGEWLRWDSVIVLIVIIIRIRIMYISIVTMKVRAHVEG